MQPTPLSSIQITVGNRSILKGVIGAILTIGKLVKAKVYTDDKDKVRNLDAYYLWAEDDETGQPSRNRFDFSFDGAREQFGHIAWAAGIPAGELSVADIMMRLDSKQIQADLSEDYGNWNNARPIGS